MPSRPTPFGDIKRTVEAYHQALDDGYPAAGSVSARSAMTAAAAALDLSVNSNSRQRITERLNIAAALGVQVRHWPRVDDTFASNVLLRYRTYDAEFQDAESRLTRPGAARTTGTTPPSAKAPGRARAGLLPGSQPAREAPSPVPPTPAATVAAPTLEELAAKIVPILRKGPLTFEQLKEKLAADYEDAALAVSKAIEAGANIHKRNGLYHLDDAPMHGAHHADDLAFTTDADGTFTFAISTDQHLCSKYERLDCLNDFYDEVQKRGIRTVLNAGNYIDGEAPFNRHELLVHGMDAQLQYLASHYPRRDGVTTYAVSGSDHEGWYSRREGVDIGRYAENTMRNANRTDWVDLGYVERAIPLRHHSSGEGSNILVMHPGGGSAYATSYIPQKIVESFDGGEKPGALVLGHYHKADYTYMRNVHTMQGGCFQDQSLFMRSKRLSAHLGGCFVRLTVDPRTGAFVECSYTFRAYYVKEYYNGRWSQSGPVNYAPRGQ